MKISYEIYNYSLKIRENRARQNELYHAIMIVCKLYKNSAVFTLLLCIRDDAMMANAQRKAAVCRVYTPHRGVIFVP